jgi:hypothetical protein
MISKSLSTSEKRAALHRAAGPLAEFSQGLYPLLIVHADDFGRLQGDLFTVQHVVDPSSPRQVNDFRVALTALDTVGLIQWYEVEGRQFVQIVDFEAHQVGLHKRTASRIPGNSGKFPEVPCQEKRREGKRREEKGTKDSSEPKMPASEPTAEIEVFPTVGGGAFVLPEPQAEELTALFPTLDVAQELRSAKAWLVANPTKRKTAKGMPKFLTAWCTRSTSQQRSTGGQPARTSSETQPVFEPWSCPHLEEHLGRYACAIATKLHRARRPGL